MKEKTKNKKTMSDFKQVLIKKALGYDVKEVVEEYVSDEDGTVKLAKKKVTKKNVPPDMTALKILLDSEKPISSMSDEELETEKARLLELLKQNS